MWQTVAVVGVEVVTEGCQKVHKISTPPSQDTSFYWIYSHHQPRWPSSTRSYWALPKYSRHSALLQHYCPTWCHHCYFNLGTIRYQTQWRASQDGISSPCLPTGYPGLLHQIHITTKRKRIQHSLRVLWRWLCWWSTNSSIIRRIRHNYQWWRYFRVLQKTTSRLSFNVWSWTSLPSQYS